jgi:hypothetical protein
VTLHRLRLVAPSGARVSVDLPADAPVSHVVAGVRFAGGSFGTAFSIGARGYHDFACRHVAPAVARERFVVSGREVVVAEAVDGASSMATLLGDYHELMTVYAGPAPARDRISALFGTLRVTDQVGGMVVRPRSAALLDLMSEQVIISVRGRGSVCVPGPRQARDLVPRHAGAPTRHGEVWKLAPPAESATRAAGPGSAPTDGPGAPAPQGRSFVMGFPAGVAQVHLAGRDAAEETLLDWLDDLNVTWHDAA